MYDVQLSNISFCYDAVCAVKDVSFNIKKGEFVVIIGPNGGGKSTLLKIILGLLKPDEGEISVNKDAVVGYLPQTTPFDKSFPITVEEAILTGTLSGRMKLFHKYSADDLKSAVKAMEYTDIIPLAKRRIDQLSTGQLKRVLIARSLAGGCDILIFDEPSESLDKNSAQELNTLINNLKGKLTIILVTHDMDFAFQTADSFIFVSFNVVYLKNDPNGRQYIMDAYNGGRTNA